MVQQLIAWALGPSGVKILDWYVAHSLEINGTLVLLAILAMVFPRQRARVQTLLGGLWAKSPLALSKQDREAVERARARYDVRKRGGKAK